MLAPDQLLGEQEILNIFAACGREDLNGQLSAKGNASHMMAELNAGRKVKARTVANFLHIEQRGLQIAQEIAAEFGDVRVPEHIGSFFKFRIDKSQEQHTIGFVFGYLQTLVEKYGISQYSASQTSLNQIFQIFAKQAEVFFSDFGNFKSMDLMLEKMSW